MDRANNMITEECHFYEFVNLDQKHTGIEKVIIHVYYGGKKISHGPRVKVSNVYDLYRSNDKFTINVGTLETEGVVKISSEELEQVRKWVELNISTIHQFWRHGDELVTDYFLSAFKKIE